MPAIEKEIQKINGLLVSFKQQLYSNIEQAKLLNEEAMLLSEKINYRQGIANAVHNFGLYELNKGNFSEALEKFKSSIELKEALPDRIGICASDINIGIVYYHLEDYTQALVYFEEAYTIAKEENDRQLEFKAIANLGMVYGEKKEFEKSMEYYLRALDLARELKADASIPLMLDSIGVLYRMQKKFEKAFEYHTEALKLKKQLDDKPNIARSLGNIASVYFEEGKLKEAIVWFKKGLKISLEIEEKNITKTIYNNLAQSYARLKQYENAYKYKLFYEEFKESVMSEKSILQIAEIEAKYKTKKKEREIERLKSTLEEKENLINKILAKQERIPLPEHFCSLSKREVEVLSYVSLGLTDKEVSEKIFVSVNTTKTHLRKIFSKLGVKNRTELVALFHRYDFQTGN